MADHGSLSRYVNKKCRCVLCRAANRDEKRRNRGRIRECSDSELWWAVEIASQLTSNPSLRNDLMRASEKLKPEGVLHESQTERLLKGEQ